MIEVEKITKHYGRTLAVDGISFSVEKGEILGFLGPNGAGKTTTMRILTCFMPAGSGRAAVAGYDCFKNPLEVKKRVGYLPESAPLYREMKVNEFLNFAASIKGLRGQAKKSRMDKVMQETSIAEVSGRLIGNISKGYRQRVCLAQALINDPEVLILDEPTIGLDPKQIVGIRQLIKNLAGERTVVLSTHILPEVSLVCDRVLIIHKGRVVAQDTPENLTAQRQSRNVLQVTVDGKPEEVKAFLESFESVKEVEAAEGRKENGRPFDVITDAGVDIRRKLAAAIVNRGWGLLELKQKTLSLEEIFVDLITDEDEGGGESV